MKYIFAWTLVLALVVGAAAHAAPVRAAVSLGVTPSLVEISAKAGSTGQVELSVLNQGDEPFSVALAPQAYDRADPGLSVPEWLSLNTTEARVEAGAHASVVVSVAVPKDVPSGSRYAVVAITTVSDDPEQRGGASIAGRLLVPFFITVEGKGKLKRDASVERFAPTLELDGRLGFRAEVRNEGNIHWKLKGETKVANGDGSSYGSLELERTTILPGTSRLIATTTTLPVQPGASYQATVHVDFGTKKPEEAETKFTFTPELTVSGNACENLDRGPRMTTVLANSGDLGVVSSVNMTVSDANGRQFAQTGYLNPELAWPNGTTDVAAELPDRLQSGDYVLTVQVQTGASPDPIVQEIPFSIGGTGPNVAPICPQPEPTSGA